MDDVFEPTQFDENGKPTFYRINFDKYRESLSPAARRNYDRRHKVNEITYAMYRKILWTHWPILSYVYSFWHGIFEDGIKATCKPRWGGVTFGYLNDGIKPTLWHTYMQLTRNHMNKYCGIYPEGAPKSRKQADEWQAKWAESRKTGDE